MPTQEVLPNCIAVRNEKSVVWANGIKWLPTFCANCGVQGGLVMEVEWDRVKNFAFYLCENCAEKWSPLVDHALAPDQVFWNKVREAQLEHFGRDLTEIEIIEALKDDSHVLTKLSKDRYDLATITT